MIAVSTTLLGRGGELHLIGGSIGLIACVTELCFQDAATGHSWDPPEPNSKLRKAVSFASITFVLLAGPAAALFWHFAPLGFLLRSLHAASGLLCVALLMQTKLVLDESQNPWWGNSLNNAEALQLWATLVVLLGYILSHDFELFVPSFSVVWGMTLRGIAWVQYHTIKLCCCVPLKARSMTNHISTSLSEPLLDAELTTSLDQVDVEAAGETVVEQSHGSLSQVAQSNDDSVNQFAQSNGDSVNQFAQNNDDFVNQVAHNNDDFVNQVAHNNDDFVNQVAQSNDDSMNLVAQNNDDSVDQVEHDNTAGTVEDVLTHNNERVAHDTSISLSNFSESEPNTIPRNTFQSESASDETRTGEEEKYVDVGDMELISDDDVDSRYSMEPTCMNRVANNFCSVLVSSHLPAVFGCSAYLTALAVSACALFVAFLMQEPKTSCFGRNTDMYYTPLELSSASTTLPTYSELGGGYGLEFSHVDLQFSLVHYDHKSTAKRVLWETVPHVAFIQLSYNPYVVQAYNGMFQFEFYENIGLFAGVNQAPVRQEIISVAVPNPGNVQIVGNLIIPKGQASPIDDTVRYEIEETKSYTMTLTRDENQNSQIHFQIDVEGLDEERRGVQLFLTSKSTSQESFHGLGTQLSYLDLKGGCVPVLAQGKGTGRGLQPLSFLLNHFQQGTGGSWQTVSSSVPVAISSHHGTTLLHTHQLSVFDLSHPNMTLISEFVSEGTSTATLYGSFINAHGVDRVVEEVSALNGRSAGPPDWVLAQGGSVLAVGGGSQVVMDTVQQVLASSSAVQAIFIQDWTGRRTIDGAVTTWWNWEIDRELYPNWEGLCEWLAQYGIKVLVYLNPHLEDVVAQHKGNYDRNLFQLAFLNDCLVKNRHGTVLQRTARHPAPFGTIDISIDRCRDWFVRELAIPIYKLGVIGWLADFGEESTWKLGMEFHNSFPKYWAEANSLVRQQGASDILIIMKSAALGSSQYSDVLWTGEQATTFDKFDGLQSALVGSLMAGMSGYPFVHSSVGGHNMIDTGPFKLLRHRELLIRWMEYSAFADVIFWTDLGTPALSKYAAQVWSTDDTLTHFRRLTQVHRVLVPYRLRLVDQARKFGWPLVRPTFFRVANATKFERSQLSKQFMLGDDIIVCPAMDYGVSSVKCHVPDDVRSWRQLCGGSSSFEANDSSAQSPSFVTVLSECKTPLGRPCVLIRDTFTPASVVVALESLLCSING